MERQADVTIRTGYSLAVAVAAVLCVLQVFLPWMSLNVEVPILGSVGSLTRYGYEGDGLITLVVGMLALGFAMYIWSDRGEKTLRLVTIFNGCLGVLIVAISLVNLVDAERGLGDGLQRLGVNPDLLIGLDVGNATSTGAGIYVAIAGGVVLAVASLATGMAHRYGVADTADRDTSG
jgi:hypothetical protein